MVHPMRVDKKITEAAAFTLSEICELKDREIPGSALWCRLDVLERRMTYVTHQCERREVVFAKALYMLEYNEVEGPGYLSEQSKQLLLPIGA